ncbi:MAG: tetratricopeptide (TPR) repeat protein, partial [Verrucomicrobiales bacterium]
CCMAGPVSIRAAVLDGLDDKGGKLDTSPRWDANFADRTVGHLMIQAGQAFNQGDLRTSLEHLRAAKRRLPLSEEIKLATAHILARLDEYDESLDEIYSLLDSDPKNAGYLRLVGYNLEKLDRNDEAIEMYERLARVAKTSEKPYIYSGAVYFRMGNIDKAIESYQKAVEINPGDASSLEALGSAWYQSERYDEAIAAYKKAIEANPEYADAHNSLGTAYYAAGQVEEAMQAVRRALNIDPRMARAYNNLAGMYALQKNPMAAIELLVIALDLDLFAPTSWANTLIALKDVIEKPEGWVMPEPADELDRVSLAAWHFREASKYTKGKDLLKAFQHLVIAVQTDPGNDQSYLQIGRIITQSNFPGIGMHFFRMALALNPNNTVAQENLQELMSHMSTARLNQAVGSLAQAIKDNPENAAAHYQLAMLYATNNKLSNAIPHLVRTVQIQPDSIPARLSLSRSLHVAGQYDAALEAMLSTFAVDVRSAEAWMQLLNSIQLMLPKIKDWTFPMPEDPADMTPVEYAGWHYRKATMVDAADTNGWIKAANHLYEAILKDQTKSTYFDEMGALLDQHVSARVAEPFYLLAAEIDPESQTIKQHISAIRDKAYIEGLEARRTALNRAIKNFPENPENYVKLAILYAENNHVKLALPELARALKLDPKHALARLTLARAMHVTGQTAQSIELLEQLLAEDEGNPFYKHRIAWLIMDSKDPAIRSQMDKAFTLAKDACDTLSPEAPPDLLRTLAQIYHARKDDANAVRTAVKAAKAAQAKDMVDLAQALLEEAKRYKAAMSDADPDTKTP